MENNEKDENEEKEGLLVKFKKFVNRNSIRIKAGVAATIVAGSIGVASWNLGKEDTIEIPGPTNSHEEVDPTYNPEDEDNNTIVITPGPTQTPEGNDDEHNHTGEDEHNHETTTPTGQGDGTHTSTEQPEENHTHKFGNWKALDSETEIRECECGKVEKRGHTLNETLVSYEAKEDDIHLVTTTQTCKTCDYTKSKTEIEDCSYVIVNYDDEFEYKTCSDCSKEKKTEHILNNGVINEDGTITYSCINDGCEYTIVKENTITPPIEHTHNYESPVISYIDMGDKGHIKVTTQTCNEEGCPNPVLEVKNENTTLHIYGAGINGIDSETGKPIVTYTCKDCGHQKVVERTQGPVTPEEHTHNFNSEPTINYEQTENGHIRVLTYNCIDPNCPNPQETKVVKSDVTAHNYDREHGVISEDGKTITYTCECGKTLTETYTKPSAEHTHKYEDKGLLSYENITETEHTKVLVKKCTDENCPKPEETQVTRETTTHTYDTGKPGVVDRKEGTIFTCECDHTKFVEKTHGPIDPVHSHTYDGEATIDYENITETGHIKVLTYTCTDPNCPNKTETKVEKSELTTHNYDKEHGVVSEDGKTITYSCECGKTLTEAYIKPPVEHTHKYDGEPSISYKESGEGHVKVSTYTCTDPNCPNKTETMTQESDEIISHTYDNGKPHTTTDGKAGTLYTCSCGKTRFEENTIKPEDPIMIDTSSITIDPASLEFTYDGQPHSPVISGIPENLTPRFISIKGTDAGEYTWIIEFDAPEGYKAEPLEINYKINPKEITLNFGYNEETSTFDAIYEGIVSDDVKTSYTVNGEEITGISSSLDEFGLYKVESSIEINPEKINNYIISDELNKTAIYEVKPENTWYDIDTEYHEEDGKIVVDIFLTTDKIPYAEYGIAPALDFNIYFDTEKLEYDESDVFSDGDEEWMGDANPLNFNNPDVENNGLGVSTIGFYDDRSDIQRVKVCQLTFTQTNPEDKDIIIKFDDIYLGAGTDIEDEYGDDILPFGYTSNPIYCIINPTNNIQTIIKKNSLLDNVIYEFEDIYDEEDKALSLEILKQYIDNGYKIPNEYINNENDDDYSDEELGEEELEDYEDQEEQNAVEKVTEDESETTETQEETTEEDTTISSPSIDELMENAPTVQEIIESGMSVEDILESAPSVEEILSKVESVDEIIGSEIQDDENEKPKVYTLTNNQ